MVAGVSWSGDDDQSRRLPYAAHESPDIVAKIGATPREETELRIPSL
jgi:hypothetical protein